MKVLILKAPTKEDWMEVKRRALVTAGLEPIQEPTDEWKKKMLRCRHSPVRYLTFSFLLKDIPYWLSTELCRHHIGCEKYVRSQRDDRNNDTVSRTEKPQGALVDMILDCNAESLMTIMNKRLCGCATREMQTLMLMLRAILITLNPEFEPFLVPVCEYTGNCNEFKSCRKTALFFQK